LQDFGDYSDGYYSVQTADGEKIAQLIGGYIDVILKKVRGGLIVRVRENGDSVSCFPTFCLSEAREGPGHRGRRGFDHVGGRGLAGQGHPDESWTGRMAEEGSIALPGIVRHANGASKGFHALGL